MTRHGREMAQKKNGRMKQEGRRMRESEEDGREGRE